MNKTWVCVAFVFLLACDNVEPGQGIGRSHFDIPELAGYECSSYINEIGYDSSSDAFVELIVSQHIDANSFALCNADACMVYDNSLRESGVVLLNNAQVGSLITPSNELAYYEDADAVYTPDLLCSYMAWGEDPQTHGEGHNGVAIAAQLWTIDTFIDYKLEAGYSLTTVEEFPSSNTDWVCSVSSPGDTSAATIILCN